MHAPEEQTILRKYSRRVILHKHDRLLGFIRAGAMSSYNVYGLIYVKTDTWSTFSMTRSGMIDDRYRIPIVYSHTCLSFRSSRSAIFIQSCSSASVQYGGFRQIPPPALTKGALLVGDFKTMNDRIVYIVFHRLHQIPDIRSALKIVECIDRDRYGIVLGKSTSRQANCQDGYTNTCMYALTV